MKNTTTLPAIITKALPALSGSSLTYNAEKSKPPSLQIFWKRGYRNEHKKLTSSYCRRKKQADGF